MKPIVFDIDLFDMLRDRSIEKRVAILELHDTHIKYQLSFTSEHSYDDECLIWEKLVVNQRSVFLRSGIVAVHYFRHQTARCWKLEIECAGAHESIVINFKKEAIGLPAYEAMTDYIVNSDIKQSAIVHL